jgi:hypothetical protein
VEDDMGGYVICVGGRRNAYKILDNLKRWKDNGTFDLKAVRSEDVD